MAEPCPRQTEALAYLAGEQAPDYAAHLEACFDCQEALADAAETLHALEPVLPVESSGEAAHQAVSSPHTPRGWPWIAALGSLAAALLIALMLPGEPPPAPTPDDLASIDLSWDDPLDAELDDLDQAFDDLSLLEL